METTNNMQASERIWEPEKTQDSKQQAQTKPQTIVKGTNSNANHLLGFIQEKEVVVKRPLVKRNLKKDGYSRMAANQKNYMYNFDKEKFV